VSVVLADAGEAMLWGGELLLRDGEPAGQLTSGAYGATLGAAVGLAYLRDPDGGLATAELARSGSYQVNIGGQLVPATVHLRPPYDPAGSRIRARAAAVTG
jgi:glycine cleavage system aminomethyltransferase T